jgi:hypothetical protein
LNLDVRQLQLAATRTVDQRRVAAIDPAAEMLQEFHVVCSMSEHRPRAGRGGDEHGYSDFPALEPAAAWAAGAKNIL